MLQLKVFKDVTAYSKASADEEVVNAVLPDRTTYQIESFTELDADYTEVTLVEPLLGKVKWAVPSKFSRFYETNIVLKVISDTLFKQAPKQSTELSEFDKVFVPNGTKFYLNSYLPAEGQHTKVAIADDFLGSKNLTTWYVYEPDVEIVGDAITLTVETETLLKPNVLQAKDQNDDAVLYCLPPGSSLPLVSHETADYNHAKVELARPLPGMGNSVEWYAYKGHIQIEGNEADNQPKHEQPRPEPSGPSIVVPGAGTVFLNQPIIENGNFTWGEATHNGTRIPVNTSVKNGIVRIAKAMEEARDRLGGTPITVTSWYRDPVTNRRVGGASRSRHLSGDAVDFVVPRMHPYDVYDRLNRWWGAKGGLASATVFTHIDMRGYHARWSYGF